eukprot:scaffold7055_cov254-Pinguiococcus_pyrenoidosus.AAC.23
MQPPGVAALNVRLPDDVVMALAHGARQVFMDQPMLLELCAPVNVCGEGLLGPKPSQNLQASRGMSRARRRARSVPRPAGVV